MKYKYSKARLGLLTGIAMVLVGCSSLSDVRPDGTAETLVWPKVERVTFNSKQGVFPTSEALSLIESGMTEDQLYYLLGRPHFNEGFGSREWNYLLHFRTPGQGVDGVTSCQFKILFDSKRLARSFHWLSVGEGAGCPPGTAPQTYTLGADALFEFNRSTLGAVTAGNQELANLANTLKNVKDVRSIMVTGHTDRLGSDAYNYRLSTARANTIRNYLIQNGVAADLVHAKGIGKSEPVVQCDGSGAQLISCLAPNRRVEISVER